MSSSAMPRDNRSMRRSSPKLPIVYQKTLLSPASFPLNNKPASRFGQRKFITISFYLQAAAYFCRTEHAFSSDSPSRLAQNETASGRG
jgi:hypothetical protein